MVKYERSSRFRQAAAFACGCSRWAKSGQARADLLLSMCPALPIHLNKLHVDSYSELVDPSLDVRLSANANEFP